jgi:hypothetical protein
MMIGNRKRLKFNRAGGRANTLPPFLLSIHADNKTETDSTKSKLINNNKSK